MGKPGGFFKRLHARQSRQASRQRRGTKGASKEERRRKREEQAIYYAAKREAEQLAAVSSSSDDDADELASTDSDRVLKARQKGLHKLHSALRVRTSERRGKHRSGPRGERPSEEEGGLTSAASRRVPREEAGAAEEDGSVLSSEAEEEALAALRVRSRTKRSLDALKKKKKKEASRSEGAGAGAGAGAGEEEDWRQIIGEDEEEDEEQVVELASDGLEEDDELLADLDDDDDDDDDDDEEGQENPLLALGGEEGGEMDDAGDDLFDRRRRTRREEEEEEEEREDTFVDDDDDASGAPMNRRRAKAKEDGAAAALLLPAFQLGTTTIETLQKSGVVDPSDPWFRKFHADDPFPQPGRRPAAAAPSQGMEPVPLTPAALTALEHSYDAFIAKARHDAAVLEARHQHRLPSFVRAEDFEALRPTNNVAVDATAVGRDGLLHAPFDPSSPAGPSSDLAAASIAAAERPPYLHPELWERWKRYRERQSRTIHTGEERGLFDLCQGYADVFDTTRAWQKAPSRREIFLLHLLNHWFKARAVVAAHDAILEAKEKKKKQMRKQRKRQLRKKRKAQKEVAGVKRQRDDMEASLDEEEMDDDDDDDYELRDRGFSKTRLLVMLPMRHHAYQYVHTLAEILGVDVNACPKLGTFQQDFTEVEEAVDPTFRRRPRDYQREFEGNIDDSFCVGIKLEPHRFSVYAHPLNSDIIFCSPLGLRRRMEKNGDALVSLSSIEVCVVDYAHVLLQQNWTHVAVVLEELLNQRPLDTTRGLSDLRRTYAWALENRSASHRQTIVSSDISAAAMLNTVRAMPNAWGRVALYPKHQPGVLTQVKVPVQQHFLRFIPSSIASNDNDRFEYFTQQVFPTRLNSLAERDVRMIVYVPSYFDFVRLRTFLHREYRETYAALSEYSSIKQQRKALGQFSDLERPVLLVTERFYYFKRYFVNMSEVVVFYSPPLLPQFYTSFVNRLVPNSPNAFAMTIFSRYDVHELVRIVGTDKAQQLLQRDANVYSFITS
eukprot:gene253-127_t